MAVSKYAYVKGFESKSTCLPETWIVITVVGPHWAIEDHITTKPSDETALRLMKQCAEKTMHKYLDVVLAYGHRDEFIFVFKKSTTLFNRRPSKIVTNVVSDFTAYYFSSWNHFFPSSELQHLPSFEGQIMTFPNLKTIQDYLSWKQEDCHIRNLNSTCLWNLVHSGMTSEEAQSKLSETDEKDKERLLFDQFSIDYDSLPQILCKGSCLTWSSSHAGSRLIVATHEDLTGKSFWTQHLDIFESTMSRRIQIGSVASTSKMHAYVKKFKNEARCLPETWIVLRLDGQGLNRFSSYDCTNQDYENALRLMNRCADSVVSKFSGIILAYGHSDQYNFVFGRSTNLFERNPSKIASTVVAYFSVCYAFYWSSFFPDIQLQSPPSFNGQLLTLLDLSAVQDDLKEMQVDCHLNGTFFWSSVLSGVTFEDAEKKLHETDGKDKKVFQSVKCDMLPHIFCEGSCLTPSPISNAAVKDIAEESFWTKLHDTTGSDVLEGTRSRPHQIYEHEDMCFPETWTVLRLDGQCFSKFSEDHNFAKPNDENALELMNHCAESVVCKFSDILLAYGQSDEYSFVFKRNTTLFEGRTSKILTSVVSNFTVCYLSSWSSFFLATHLQYPPLFVGEMMTFPNITTLQDYLCWRQRDCHLHSLYDTCFWALVHSGMTPEDVEKRLRKASKKDKNELLFSQFSINYNTLPQIFRKGTCLMRASSPTGKRVVVSHEDLKVNSLWMNDPDVLAGASINSLCAASFSKFSLLPGTWVVVRLDGRCFHKFSVDHNFTKPNDENALRLMNECAESVVRKFSDIVLAYGQSDEYSFVFKRNTTLFEGRPSKILTSLVSHFTVSYLSSWSSFFPATQLQYPPSFDGRIVTYPSIRTIRDYLSWRQADCHINNLYNTTFWALVHSGTTLKDAEKKLCGTDKNIKKELLADHSIIYDSLPQIFRKGSCLIWASSPTGRTVVTTHEDIIGESFWVRQPDILVTSEPATT